MGEVPLYTVGSLMRRRTPYRGTSLIRNSPPPWDHLRTLDIVPL